ncbi:SWIM zinc finger family protein [Clostridium sp. UBA6640]|uniref:SWIM zinc finger family protein n=1 Tax=Clostridium sp. UBA6640 TaxID=1946370 RepID=UPI0025C04897|nr:hypothetical protein [Clostridium sp. UBA6640]
MNINNFENYIDKKILDRGYGYYCEGNITDVYKEGDNEYTFQVQGSEDYEIRVEINNHGEILYSDCNCPYEFGPICKHQVAVYFELANILNSKEIKKELITQPTIKEVLNDISKEELINIIMDVAKKDKVFRNSIIFKYSKGTNEQEIEKCKKMMDSIIEKYISRKGFIEYGEVYSFVNEMESLLDKVKNTENPLLALDIAFLILDECIEAFQYVDDSDGDIGNFALGIIELIRKIAIDSKKLDISQRKEIFNKLLNKSDSKAFDEWEDYKIDILRICAEFADDEEFRNKLREKLKDMINESSSDNSDDHSIEYISENIHIVLFDIINEYDTEEEADKFVKDNLKFTYFRDILVNKYIKEKNYNKVIEFALEGEEKYKEYRGLVLKWKKIRYMAYKELSFKEEQEKLAKELLFDGDFEYYKELKSLVTGDKSGFYNKLKEELKISHTWMSKDIYLKLIIDENDLDEIMEIVRKNPETIEDYASMLIDKFKDEVLEIYESHIKLQADRSSSRNQYQGICRMLKRYEKIAGSGDKQRIVNELKILHKRRPAFLDELRKI